MKKILLALVIATTTIGTNSIIYACNNSNKIDINNLIKVRALGQFPMTKIYPRLTEILTAINNLNQTTFTSDDLQFKQGSLLSTTNATISGVGKYQGAISLEFTRLPLSNSDIVDAIKTVSTYANALTADTNNYARLEKQISNNNFKFIKNGLFGNANLDFDYAKFQLIDIEQENGTKINDNDLASVTNIGNAKLLKMIKILFFRNYQ